MEVDPASVGKVVGAIASVGAAALVLRKVLSKDRTDIVKDRAEENLIGRLQTERDAAQAERDEALAEAKKEREKRTEDAQLIAGLKSEADYLRREIFRLNSYMRKIARGLPPETQRVLLTDFVGLPEDDPNERNPS